jgi:hypothetical protein
LRNRAVVRVSPPTLKLKRLSGETRKGAEKSVPDRSYADDCVTATKIVTSADMQICVDGRYAWIIVLGIVWENSRSVK